MSLSLEGRRAEELPSVRSALGRASRTRGEAVERRENPVRNPAGVVATAGAAVVFAAGAGAGAEPETAVVVVVAKVGSRRVDSW